MRNKAGRCVLPAVMLAFVSGAAIAQDEEKSGGMFGWVRGDWYLTVGAAGFLAPDFEGSDHRIFRAQPMISLGKAGPEARFVSRNDNISLSLLETQDVRAGVTGKFIFGRDLDDTDAEGLDDIEMGGEVGVFAEVYPTDNVRIRGEVRHGVRSHDGVVADVAVDAFADVTDTVRVSAGPRISFANANYFDAYYGVDGDEAARSGISEYAPSGGVRAIGVGGAVTWKTTDKLTTSVFAEYSRLQGPAAKSSLVEERGSENQFMIGASATYRFDFKM